MAGKIAQRLGAVTAFPESDSQQPSQRGLMPSSGIKAYMPIEHSYIKSIFFKKKMVWMGTQRECQDYYFECLRWVNTQENEPFSTMLSRSQSTLTSRTIEPVHCTLSLLEGQRNNRQLLSKPPSQNVNPMAPLHSCKDMKLLLTGCSSGHEQLSVSVGSGVVKPQTEGVDSSPAWDGS